LAELVKSLSPALKLSIFKEFADFFVAAGYKIASIEIGSIEPQSGLQGFAISAFQGFGSGLLVNHTSYDDAPSSGQSRKSMKILWCMAVLFREVTFQVTYNGTT
jgi:hypothetical protein